MSEDSFYARLSGYDALAAVANNLLPRLTGDDQVGRFWAHRGDDGSAREKQLLIDFLAFSSGGDMVYTGGNMIDTHKGMRISDSDWTAFVGHLKATLAEFQVPEPEQNDVLGFMESLKSEIVEA